MLFALLGALYGLMGHMQVSPVLPWGHFRSGKRHEVGKHNLLLLAHSGSGLNQARNRVPCGELAVSHLNDSLRGGLSPRTGNWEMKPCTDTLKLYTCWLQCQETGCRLSKTMQPGYYKDILGEAIILIKSKSD